MPRITKAKGRQIRDWHLNRRGSADLSILAREINPQVQGWINDVGWVHWTRPGIGSASAAREISSLRSPENSQVSVIVRISATRP